MKMLSYCPMDPMGNAIRAVPSHPMGHFPWDSHGNPIPMDKPRNTPLCAKPAGKILWYSGSKWPFLRLKFEQI